MAQFVWHDKLETARAAAAEGGRLLLTDFWSPG